MARRTWWAATLLASLGLLVSCGGADGGTGSGSDHPEGHSSGATESDDSPAAAENPLELTVPTAQSGRCMAPSVENLRAQDTAFEGTVTEVSDGAASLDVSTMYAGEAVEEVTVDVPDQAMTDLVLAVDFEAGRTYLVSSLDGQVSLCGLSGPKDELLAGLYEEAFGG